jgi:NADPH:quinone reductase
LHDIARVQAGQTVLIHAAAGGIGQILVQWAKALGARVIATTSTPDKLRLVHGLGADHVIDYSMQDFAAEVMALTAGQGTDVVFDSAGKTTFVGSLDALALRGHLVSFGQASGPVGSYDIDRLSAKSATLSRPNYAHYTDTPEKLARHVSRFFAALRSGDVKLGAPTAYPLERAADAHRDLEARRTTGSVILTV